MDTDSVQDAFTRATFTQVILRRETPVDAEYIDTTLAKDDEVETYFQVNCPYVRSNQKVAVVGSIPELGEWKVENAVVFADSEFPMWHGHVAIKAQNFPFQYKFVILNEDGSAIWEPYNNRTTNGPTKKNDKVIFCINEWFTCPNTELFKGLGIYVPIFSLRTKNSQGIGSYTDLKECVDCCNKIGASMIQLLPINDTTDAGQWADSYPYKQVSCFALHPVYIDLLEISKNLPQDLLDEIMDTKDKLEALPELDYPAVYKLNMDTLKKIFALVKDEFIKSDELDKFLAKNGEWLKPYALFCQLRDEFQTMDYKKWGKYARVTPEEIEKYCEDKKDDLVFIYWVQYIAETQFRESYKYASEHHVALKGDLPIGVNINSVECWSQPNLFRMDMCAGAPPDDFSSDGQNWGFPTYNWEEMEKDGFKWWRARLARMSELYHTLRVDHILGFFRIWEIPRETCVRGLLGHFHPAYPLGRQELEQMGLWDIDRYVKPYIRYHLLHDKFGDKTNEIAQKYFISRNCFPVDDYYDFKEEYNTEKKIVEAISNDAAYTEDEKRHIITCLEQLVSNVLLVPDPEHWDCYHVRTEVTKEHTEQDQKGIKIFYSSSWNELPGDQKEKFKNLYHEFTYKRHTGLWVEKSRAKLNILKKATKMLICGEDLGQITPEIIQTIQEFGLLSLRVQRMSKDPKDAFDNYHEFPYLSVACPSTHDCTSLRGWWEESTDITNNFWYNILLKRTPCPGVLDCKTQEEILSQNLWSNAMWAIFLLQDLTGICEDLRLQTPDDERINIPADPNHHWRYRYPFTLEELAKNGKFTKKMMDLAVGSHRI